MIKNLVNYAFPVLRDIYGVGGDDINNLDPGEFVEKVQRVHRGFSAEHEFAAIASWLGKCSLVTQLDDVMHSSGMYRAPDFLVVVSLKGQEVPFLVEVKSEVSDRLKWSAGYIESLKAFANLVNLPLLVAWKRGRLWALVDAAIFSQKVTAFHLSFEDAIKNSLMSALFRNVWIAFAEGFRLELTLRIQGEIDLTADLLPEGTYEFKIEDAGLWGRKGRLTPDQGKDLWWFLVTAASERRFDRVRDVASQQFLANSESMFNLSDVLLAQLFWNKSEGDDIDWLSEIRKGLPRIANDLDVVLHRALDVGAVRYVFEQVPEIVPAFLKQVK